MKRSALIVFTGIVLSLISCKKNTTPPAPVASFNFRGQDLDGFKTATYDTCTLISSSTNAKSFQWDLGNGVTSDKDQVVLSYTKSGTYTVKLTVTSEDGKQSSVEKKVTVLDRVLKRIVIESVYWDPIPKNIDHFNYVWPETTTASVFVQFRHYTMGDLIVDYSGLMPNSPILLTSGEISNVANQTTSSIEVPFSGKFIIDKAMVSDRTLTVFLMAKDASGTVYNLMSNKENGTAWGFIKEDFANNTFTIKCYQMSSVRLEGDFE